MGQDVVEEELISFDSWVEHWIFYGLRSLEKTSLLRSGGRTVYRQLLAESIFEKGLADSDEQKLNKKLQTISLTNSFSYTSCQTN